MTVRFDAEPWDYLGADEAIDVEHPAVQALASALRTGDDRAYAAAAFTHVRDAVTHCLDVGDPRVPWKASDVLEQGTGFCYAKAHALVAVLRAGGVQAGLCYQRLRADDGFVVHGLAAALVDDRWVRLDPRGGPPGAHVEFAADSDRLVFAADGAGETTYPTVYAAPHPAVLSALRSATDAFDLAGNGLPATL
ncbi:transglutaminase-like domain-containing protein [Actinomadura atramentaria]|uniref:transglutaminase-like domain-containing protein n=1 Tax=Actinomadura atramentaria TaxID=1990 RepID=UPI00036E6A93|nr:transglutaminase family protein [Actinomadura atramentaria]